MELSGRIKAARLHLAETLGRKISQKVLGEMCGDWSQNRISYYETGKRTASTDDCLAIARVTGVRIEWLQLNSGPMLTQEIRESACHYEINPPIIDWDEIDQYLANPSRFDLEGKNCAPFKVDDKQAFAVALPLMPGQQHSPTKTAVIIPPGNNDLNLKEVICRDKSSGEKAIKLYSRVFGSISLTDPAGTLPPINLEPDGDIDIIGLILIKYE